MHAGGYSAASPRREYGSPRTTGDLGGRRGRDMLSLSASTDDLPPDDPSLKKTPSKPPVSFLNPTPSSALRRRGPPARGAAPSGTRMPPSDYISSSSSELRAQQQQPYSSSTYASNSHGATNNSNYGASRYNTSMVNVSATYGQQQQMRSYRARRSESGGYEVTVFGFPPDKTNVIINRFQRYGEIIDKKSGSGNWVHITYKNSKGHENALHKNGYIIDGVMVGVKERNPDDDVGFLARQRDVNGFVGGQSSILHGNGGRSGVSQQQDRSMALHSKFTEPTLQRADIYASGAADGSRRKKSFCSTLMQYLLNW